MDSQQGTVSQIQSVNVMTSSPSVISPDIQEELDTLRRDGLEPGRTNIITLAKSGRRHIAQVSDTLGR